MNILEMKFSRFLIELTEKGEKAWDSTMQSGTINTNGGKKTATTTQQ
jgi:hypothetical protein